LPLLVAEIDLQNHQLVGVGMGFDRFNGRDFELEFSEIVDGYLARCYGVFRSTRVAQVARQKSNTTFSERFFS